MFCITAQHINIIAKDDILVNHFLHNFDSFLPKLLGQFFALGLDLLNATVHNASDSGEPHTCHNQAQHETNDKFTHFVFLTLI